jgi:hypothetical protein
MYKLKLSRQEKTKLVRLEWVIVATAIVAVALIIWLAWIRPMQKTAAVTSFEECAAAGNPVQESYPEVCATKDGKRFVNTKQDAAHQASLSGDEDLVPPANPELLRLDVVEWGMRIPLTKDNFDLIYTYIENGGEEYLLFTYKRLLRLRACQADIGVRLTRTPLLNEPPFTENKPAPILRLDKLYYYAKRAAKPCYNLKNAEQVALVKKIAGDKGLVKATVDLIAKSIAIPKE